jgi:imidazole glycerol-phosphate synthase subunit HisH
MTSVSVLDYGAGNLGSVRRAFQRIGCEVNVVKTPEQVLHSSVLVFPGVGSAEQAMKSLHAAGNAEALKQRAQNKLPTLGVCVGMQVLGTHSEEGNVPCLGILPYKLKKFVVAEPVPHMGWNSIDWARNHPSLSKANTGLSGGLDECGPDCYFVHSYFASESESISSEPENKVTLATTTYGSQTFSSFVAEGPIWGMQFHVEKSGKVGLALLQNFMRMASQC